MGHYLRKGNGQLNGSVGDGRDAVPTGMAVSPAELRDGEPEATAPLAGVVTALRGKPDIVRVVEIRDRGKGNLAPCEHCGTAIRFEAEVELTGGRTAVWGTSCAGFSDSERDREMVRQQHRAGKRAIAAWIADQPGLAEALAAFDAYLDHRQALIAQMDTDGVPEGLQEVVLERILLPGAVYDAVDKVRRLGPDAWEKNVTVLLDAHATGILDARPTVEPLPAHVGAVGQKLTVDVVVERRVLLEPYCYGAAHPALLIAHDAAGNPVLTKTTSAWAYQVEPGQAMTWTGTVKEHGDRFDVPQTWLTRVKAS